MLCVEPSWPQLSPRACWSPLRVCSSLTGGTEPLAVQKFVASPVEILAGSQTILTWEVVGAETVEIDNGIGSVAAKGSKQIKPVVDDHLQPFRQGGDLHGERHPAGRRRGPIRRPAAVSEPHAHAAPSTPDARSPTPTPSPRPPRARRPPKPTPTPSPSPLRRPSPTPTPSAGALSCGQPVASASGCAITISKPAPLAGRPVHRARGGHALGFLPRGRRHLARPRLQGQGQDRRRRSSWRRSSDSFDALFPSSGARLERRDHQRLPDRRGARRPGDFRSRRRGRPRAAPLHRAASLAPSSVGRHSDRGTRRRPVSWGS